MSARLLGSEFRLIADESEPIRCDLAALTRAELVEAVEYGAEVLAKRDLCKTYGKPASTDEQDQYLARHRDLWPRVLAAGRPDGEEQR